MTAPDYEAETEEEKKVVEEEKTMRCLIVRGTNEDHVAVGFMDVTGETIDGSRIYSFTLAAFTRWDLSINGKYL